MWLFLSSSFLSIVDKGDSSGKTLLVRARREGDIEPLFADAKVTRTLSNDYRYRARIDREKVATVIADKVRSIDYGNFKDTVKGRSRHDSYLAILQRMYEFQERERSGSGSLNRDPR